MSTNNAEKAAAYINEVLADLHDNPPVNDVAALAHAALEMHLGALRFILLGEPEKAQGMLSNFGIAYQMKRLSTENI